VLKRRRLLTLVISVITMVLVCAVFYRGYFGPPVITIINDSPYDVAEVVLRGDPFVKVVGRIPTKGRQTVVVHPLGESSLKMQFVANGRRVVKDDLAYIESSGGYCVTLKIDEHLEIRRVSDGGFCFAVRRAV
jgi:multidrug efflux pump subunit AcrA (membrane-fusion protein)